MIVFCGCDSPQPQPAAKAAPDQHAKITAFYARDGVVTEGGTTVLCYGVSDTKSLKIDPPVDGVWPSFNRCVEVKPKGATHYTLTALGADGQAVSQSLDLQVGADTSSLPKITSFKLEGREKDYAGQTIYQLSFADQNAVEVSIDPPVFPTLHGAPSGQFAVKPDKTTTYTLTVKGKFGHTVQQRLTVEVPAVH